MRGLNRINSGNENCFKYLIGAVISVLSNILFKKQKHRDFLLMLVSRNSQQEAQ